MIQLKKIYFIYDADGGLWNEIKYWINKNLLKKASACGLCDISHSKFFVRFEWLSFIKELKNHYQVKVLHRNELPQNIQDKNYQFPCMLGETENGHSLSHQACMGIDNFCLECFVGVHCGAVLLLGNDSLVL